MGTLPHSLRRGWAPFAVPPASRARRPGRRGRLVTGNVIGVRLHARSGRPTNEDRRRRYRTRALWHVWNVVFHTELDSFSRRTDEDGEIKTRPVEGVAVLLATAAKTQNVRRTAQHESADRRIERFHVHGDFSVWPGFAIGSEQHLLRCSHINLVDVLSHDTDVNNIVPAPTIEHPLVRLRVRNLSNRTGRGDVTVEQKVTPTLNCPHDSPEGGLLGVKPRAVVLVVNRARLLRAPPGGIALSLFGNLTNLSVSGKRGLAVVRVKGPSPFRMMDLIVGAGPSFKESGAICQESA